MALELFSTLNPVLTNMLEAVMILLIGFMAGKLLGTILYRIFVEIQLDKAVKVFSGITSSFSKFLSETIALAAYIVTFILALNTLSILGIVLKSVLVFALIVIAGAIILALNGFLPNLYGGFAIKQKKKYSVGDLITVKTAKGKVTKIGIFKTFLTTREGDMIVIRNWTAFNSAKKISR